MKLADEFYTQADLAMRMCRAQRHEKGIMWYQGY
jgi:hypothetical protein